MAEQRPKRPKLTPRNGATMAPKEPQMGPRWPKTAPRRPQDGPKMAQDGPRWPQVGPMGAQDGPQMAPRGAPNRSQIGLPRPSNIEAEKGRPQINLKRRFGPIWGPSWGPC